MKVKSEEYHDGIGLTWDDTGQPLSKREGQAWWAGWDEGRKDGEVDTREELADEIERLREENTYLQQIIKEYQRAMGFDEECSIALGEKE